jgi:1-deoxy-D-xylulose-5-phosphate synthase
LLRDGEDVTLLSYGTIALTVENAADVLAEQGIRATVINARFVKPLDERLILDQVRRTGALVTIEEAAAMGGFGSAVLELLAREGIQSPVTCLGVPDRFFDHASQGSLRKQAGLTADDVVRAAQDVMARRPVAVSP